MKNYYLKGVPSKPRNVTVNLNKDSAQIKWQPPLSDGGIESIRYR